MNRMDKILLIEDENHVAEGVAFNLRQEGLEVMIAEDGHVALDLWKSFNPDLVVLDLMLPKLDGEDILKVIRSQNEKTPILILSSKIHINNKDLCFSLGADDYLTKPFHLEELIHRIKILLKKSKWYQEKNPIPTDYEFGKNRINLETHMAQTPNGDIQLTNQEIKLLLLFINNPKKVIPRKKLLEEGWGYNDQTETRTLDIFVTKLRKYFEVNHKSPQHFISLRNKGLIFYPNP